MNSFYGLWPPLLGKFDHVYSIKHKFPMKQISYSIRKWLGNFSLVMLLLYHWPYLAWLVHILVYIQSQLLGKYTDNFSSLSFYVTTHELWKTLSKAEVSRILMPLILKTKCVMSSPTESYNLLMRSNHAMARDWKYTSFKSLAVENTRTIGITLFQTCVLFCFS